MWSCDAERKDYNKAEILPEWSRLQALLTSFNITKLYATIRKIQRLFEQAVGFPRQVTYRLLSPEPLLWAYFLGA
jgi:hypothetical protein